MTRIATRRHIIKAAPVVAVLIVAAVALALISGSGDAPAPDAAPVTSTTMVETIVPAPPEHLAPPTTTTVALTDEQVARCDADVANLADMLTLYPTYGQATSVQLRAYRDAWHNASFYCGDIGLDTRIAVNTWLSGNSFDTVIADPQRPAFDPASTAP